MRITCLASLALASCGGSDLTCDLLAEPTNCWATAAEAMAACMPARGTPATLATDRASCTFSDGVRVVFDAPLPNSVFDLDRLGFSIEANGATCARFVDTFMNRMELTADGDTVVSELLPGKDFHLRCPGEDFSTNFDTLFTCTPPAVPPTDGFDVDATTFTFSLSAVTTPGELFRCEM